MRMRSLSVTCLFKIMAIGAAYSACPTPFTKTPRIPARSYRVLYHFLEHTAGHGGANS